jgi:heme-degrading monooxygenase HmoA
MHCRAVTVQVQPGKTQEAIDIYNNSLVPACKQQKGFQGAYLMTDAATGKALSITVWASENDMVEGERNGYYQEQIAKFGAVFAGPPAMEHYELSVEAEPA